MGREVWWELGGVKEEETVNRMYCMRKESTKTLKNKMGKKK